VDCNPNRIRAVFCYYISTYQIWIESMRSFKSYWADTNFWWRTHARTHAQTGVTLNAPPPFFEWRGHKNLPNPYSEIVLRYNSLYNMWDNMIKFEKGPLLRYIVWQELLHRLTAIYLKRGESLHLLPNTHILKQLLKQYYVHFKIYFKHTMYSSCKQCSCCQLGR